MPRGSLLPETSQVRQMNDFQTTNRPKNLANFLLKKEKEGRLLFLYLLKGKCEIIDIENTRKQENRIDIHQVKVTFLSLSSLFNNF